MQVVHFIPGAFCLYFSKHLHEIPAEETELFKILPFCTTTREEKVFQLEFDGSMGCRICY